MASVMSAVSDFVNSLIGIVISLCSSVFAVFHAIFALAGDIISSVVTIVNHIFAMVLDLFSGVFGFIAANLVAIGVLAGGYYAFTQYQSRNRGITLKR